LPLAKEILRPLEDKLCPLGTKLTWLLEDVTLV